MKIDISRVSLTEADIEQYLFENPEKIRGNIPGYRIAYVDRWVGRQFTVPSGIIDLLGVLDDGAIAVVEVKLGAIDGKAIAQACRYAHDIRISTNWDVPIIKFVVGDSIDGKSMFECVATGVIPMTFSAHLSMSVGQMNWNDECMELLSRKYGELSVNEELSNLRDNWINTHGIEKDTSTEVAEAARDAKAQEVES